MGVVSEQVNIQVYGGKVINSHCVMLITLWCGDLAVSDIIRIFVLMPYILYRGIIIGGHIVSTIIWWSHLLYVSLCWCPSLREGGEYKAGWGLLSQLVPPTITKIRIKKFLYKLCIKKDCCIFVLVLWSVGDLLYILPTLLPP